MFDLTHSELPNIREKSGNTKTFQDQRKIREFEMKSGKIEMLQKKTGKSLGILFQRLFLTLIIRIHKRKPSNWFRESQICCILSYFSMFVSRKYEKFQGKVREMSGNFVAHFNWQP